MGREEYYYAIHGSLQAQDMCTTVPFVGRYHFHDNFEVYLFLSGDVDYYVEGSRYELQRGHLIVMNDKEIHRVLVHGTSPYRRCTVHFDHRIVTMLNTPTTNLLACFRDHQPGIGNALVVAEAQLDELCAMIGKIEAISGSGGYGDDVLAVLYLSELLVSVNSLFRGSKPDSPIRPTGIITEILQYIGSNLDSTLTLDSIADEFLLDKFYLSHLFRRETGDTLHHYVLIKKIAMAKHFLSEGRSVTDTCDLAGFNNYNNFIRTFKKIAGTTPGKYLRAPL